MSEIFPFEIFCTIDFNHNRFSIVNCEISLQHGAITSHDLSLQYIAACIYIHMYVCIYIYII